MQLDYTLKKLSFCRRSRKKLTELQILRDAGGPFTSAEEVDDYLAGTDDEKVKQTRMRREVAYARDTSVSFPRAHKVFRIMNTSVTPRRLLTALEFSDNLKIYLGKKEGRSFITMEDYRLAVAALNE